MRLGVYVQVPFCQTKCTYCNFHTGVFSADLYEPYVDAVCREIAEHPRLLRENGIDTVSDGVVDTAYFGGGTPSLLDPGGLHRILDAIRATFDSKLEEVTLEADPETITPEKAAAWRDAGFDRISMGVQSFNDAELKAAGRMHRRVDVYNASRMLRDSGFRNISYDLIAGLPHQTDESWDDTVAQLLALTPEHVSIYMMEIDEGSRLGLEVLQGGTRYSASALPSDDSMANFYERACERLAASGYTHYEISNWALPGFESRHNLKYWRREPYFGFGAGAHSFNGIQRWANAHDPASFARVICEGRFPVEQLDTVTAEQSLEEELFLGLRQLAGIDLARHRIDIRCQFAPAGRGTARAGLARMGWQAVAACPGSPDRLERSVRQSSKLEKHAIWRRPKQPSIPRLGVHVAWVSLPCCWLRLQSLRKLPRPPSLCLPQNPQMLRQPLLRPSNSSPKPKPSFSTCGLRAGARPGSRKISSRWIPKRSPPTPIRPWRRRRRGLLHSRGGMKIFACRRT